MNDTQLETIDQIQAFLVGSQGIDLLIEDASDFILKAKGTAVSQLTDFIQHALASN